MIGVTLIRSRRSLLGREHKFLSIACSVTILFTILLLLFFSLPACPIHQRMDSNPPPHSSSDRNMDAPSATWMRNGVMSPPPSTKPSLQSHRPNGGIVEQLERASLNGIASPSQGQLALYYDGYQVGSPPPMAQSPYPHVKQTPRNTQIEHPDYPAFLEFMRNKQAMEEEQQRQRQQLYEQQQHQQQQQQQQQQQPPPQQTQYPRYASPSPYPLPPHLQQRSQSAYASMDDYAQQYQQQQYAPQQPYVHPIRPGHNYGRITARGNAKILMGNGTSGTPTGFERQHNFGDVDLQDNVQIKQGDFGAAEIATFFGRPPVN